MVDLSGIDHRLEPRNLFRGTLHGQELPPEDMDALIRSIGRVPVQRTTLYAPAPAVQTAGSYAAESLAPLEQGGASRALPRPPLREPSPL